MHLCQVTPSLGFSFPTDFNSLLYVSHKNARLTLFIRCQLPIDRVDRKLFVKRFSHKGPSKHVPLSRLTTKYPASKIFASLLLSLSLFCPSCLITLSCVLRCHGWHTLDAICNYLNWNIHIRKRTRNTSNFEEQVTFSRHVACRVILEINIIICCQINGYFSADIWWGKLDTSSRCSFRLIFDAYQFGIGQSPHTLWTQNVDFWSHCSTL